MARTPSNTFTSVICSSFASQTFKSSPLFGVSPLYVKTRFCFRASAWKVFSVSLYRNETVSAFWARVLKSCHCLQRTITGGPRV